MIGIYCIHCRTNDKRYIGQSINIIKRKHEHKRALEGNYHTNKHLQSAFNKYGLDSFKFTVLERLPKNSAQKLLNEHEKRWIEKYKSYDQKYGFNKTNGGSDSIYFHFKSKEEIDLIREKMSKSAKGKTLTDKHKMNIGKAQIGTKRSKETIQKMKDSWTEARKQNVPKGENHPWFNRKHSKKSLKKISDILRSHNDGIKVICLNTKEVFPSAKRAGETYKIDYSQIGKVCRKTPKYNSAGKHPQTKEKLKWMFYEEYLENGGGDY